MAFHRRNSANSKTQRFSLLLLEPSEFYVDDASVYYYPDSKSEINKQYGRLKICSKSLVFDPSDSQYPIVRIPFRHCSYLGAWNIKEDKTRLLSKIEGDVLSVTSKQVIKMKENNIIAPYVFVSGVNEHRFSFVYTPLSAALPEISTLYKASSMRSQEEKQEIERLIRNREAELAFDRNWLNDIDENILIQETVRRIDALTITYGRIVLSSERLYFQPFNNIDSSPVRKYRVSEITRIVNRRYLLRDLGIELHFKRKSYFYAFDTKEIRDRFLILINRLPKLKTIVTSQENMRHKWQRKEISNFDYLIYLNIEADRSFNDLTQYPVFPWVLCDYKSPTIDLNDPSVYRDLSKPIGALDEQRLKLFLERYDNMPDPKFMYGTHYSSPGYVLFYLVRVAPEYMLCLQNGKFDNADRLFNDVAKTWDNVLRSAADVKELTPEFYDTSSGGDFLINSRNLPLGVTQDRKVVNDVVLPPWAKDADDFVSTLRAALESDHVSQNLHQWIDLVFGYKQRGKEAIEASNVFYHLTYEGAVDIDTVEDPNERAGLEMQISEFGQTPKQLFVCSHPQRNSEVDLSMENRSTSPPPSRSFLTSPPPSLNSLASDTTLKTSSFNSLNSIPSGASSPTMRTNTFWKMENLDFDFSLDAHKGAVTGVFLSEDKSLVYSVSDDYTLKIYNTETKRQIRRLIVCHFVLSCLCVLPLSQDVVIGTWDNNLYFYSVSNGRIMETWDCHNDAITCSKLKGTTLVTGSWDASVKMFTNLDGTGKRNQEKCFFADFPDHTTEITCVDFDEALSLVISGAKDGEISLWNVETQFIDVTISAHVGGVNDLALSKDGKHFVSCGEDGVFSMWSVKGECLFETVLPFQYTCLEFDGQTAIAGTEVGHIHVWDMVSRNQIKTIESSQGFIKSLYVSLDGQTVVAGTDDGQVLIHQTK